MKKILKWLLDNALFIVIIVLAIVGMLADFVGKIIITYQEFILPGETPATGDRLSILVLVVFVGIMLGFLRDLQQKLYGLIQLVVGCMGAWTLTGSNKSQDPATNLIALIGATYLIARGLYDYMEDVFKLRKQEIEDRQQRMIKHDQDMDALDKKMIEREKVYKRAEEMLKEREKRTPHEP